MMTSAAMIGGIVFLAVLWREAGYRRKLRLRVARGKPIQSSLWGSLVGTGVLLGSSAAEEAGWMCPYAALWVSVGCGAMLLALLGWVIFVSMYRPSKFRAGNAYIYGREVQRAVVQGKRKTLRALAEELPFIAPGLVAHVVMCGYGKNTKRAEWTAQVANEVLNLMTDKGLMRAMCEEGAVAPVLAIRELTKQVEWAKTDGKDHWEGIETAKQREVDLIKALTWQVTREGDRTLDEAELGDGPRGWRVHPTQARWDGTILEEVWNNKEAMGRHDARVWLNLYEAEGLDQKKARMVTTAAIDVLLGTGWKGTGGLELKHLVVRRVKLALADKGTERSFLAKIALEDFQIVVTRRREEEENGRRQEGCAVLDKPSDYTEKVAEAMIECMEEAEWEEDWHEAWRIWYGTRHRYGWNSKDDDEVWEAEIARKVDEKLWERFKRIGVQGSGWIETRLLGLYLRMEGMVQPEQVGAGWGPRTRRRRKALQRAVKARCKKELGRVLKKHEGAKRALCRAGLLVNEDKTLLTLEVKKAGGPRRATLILEP